ncbi:MAG: DUF167 domain-containing protein [Anaerolineae bacterium]
MGLERALREFKITKAEGGAAFAVRVVPRAGRNEISGVQGNALKVRLTAPPVQDAANEALIELLAKQLGVNRSQIEIAAGKTSRRKMVCVLGLLPEEVEDRLAEFL